MTVGTGTRREPPELKVWHLIVVLGLVLAIDVAWAAISW